jgi:hypothetical protein
MALEQSKRPDLNQNSYEVSRFIRLHGNGAEGSCSGVAMDSHRILLTIVIALASLIAAGASASDWRDDPVWHEGKAEWAVYESERVIYDKVRQHETVIFTNKEHVDPATTTKAENWRKPGMVEMFKFSVSRIIPTENYDYRYLSSGYVRTDTLAPYKLMTSSQEHCGTTFRQFTADDGRVNAVYFGYFPGEGESGASFQRTPNLAFHDLLALTLRDYPFDDSARPRLELMLVPTQESNQRTTLAPSPATVENLGRETIDVPFGRIDTHRLRVRHAEDGGVTESHFWFAADSRHRRVMVQYRGPHGVTMRLKRLDWWAYWKEPKPE